MRIGKIIAVLLFVGLLAVPVFAQVATPINSAGAAGAPVSVTNGVKTVLAGNVSRQHWALYSETVDIRCTLGTTAGGVGSPAPSTTVGFLFHTGVVYGESSFQLGSATAARQLDCFSTGAATNVDTWEE